MRNPLVLRHKYSIAIAVAGLSIVISLLTRIFLLLFFNRETGTSPALFPGIFGIGLLYDMIVALFIALPFVIQIAFTNNYIYTRQGKWLAIIFFAALLFILLFTSLVPRDFNKELYKGLIIYVLLRALIFLFLCTRTQEFRNKWRSGVLQSAALLVICLLVFNAISEFFFWNEFSSRYNFIAVDYLIYTNEVIGNIRESYPLYWILGLVLLITLVIFWLIRSSARHSVRTPLSFFKRIALMLAVLLCCIIPVYFVNPDWKNFSRNNYVNDLAGNGIYEFVQAFQNNELDFYKYYTVLPDSKAFSIARNGLAAPHAQFVDTDSTDLQRQISDSLPERKMNVVLISVESLSASFMASFGSTKNITPQLDSLAGKSMFFTNLYASGTRTVRGLEALSLCLPPTPGQSIVKRPQNENMFSAGSVFKSKGYTTQFIYGGYGYFDNMNYFFSHNDYEVIDRTALKPEEIHYANIWGVADEDLFTLALRTMDNNYTKGKPFFTQVMTVSNHRPYTYPDGRIDIPSSTQSREGAVKYTDYAIGHFISLAASRPWFNNTIFVIVADHCASSAGKVAMPVTGYHIPLLIYAPAYIEPQKIDYLTAQIDIIPTVMGLLHFNYTSKFFGQDVLRTPADKRRAYISTYQGLGFLNERELVINSPVRKIAAYQPDFTTGESKALTTANDSTIQQAIAFYQAAAWLIKNKKYGHIPPKK